VADVPDVLHHVEHHVGLSPPRWLRSHREGRCVCHQLLSGAAAPPDELPFGALRKWTERQGITFKGEPAAN
jgi:hypothetical protein